MRQQIQRDAHGSSSTMVKITHKDIDNWEIDLPDMDKQIKIAEQLNVITRKIDDLTSIKRKKSTNWNSTSNPLFMSMSPASGK